MRTLNKFANKTGFCQISGLNLQINQQFVVEGPTVRLGTFSNGADTVEVSRRATFEGESDDEVTDVNKKRFTISEL